MPDERFAFGRNWRSFAEKVDEARIAAAASSLTGPLGVADLAGRTFLDVGCGSGLFSLAAHRLGARVRAFDADPESVAAATGLLRAHAPDGDWSVGQGSVLDAGFVAGLGRFDVVYSWGVLHHTGDLWTAMDLACRLVAYDGLFYLSVYNDQEWRSAAWRHVKQRYNRAGPIARALLVAGGAAYLWRHAPLRAMVRVVRPEARLEGRPRPRGMSAWHDLVDWVGGFPFEVARPEEVFAFVRARDFRLRHLTTCGGGLGCNEYVFERGGSR